MTETFKQVPTEERRTDRFDLRALYETSQLLSASLDIEFVLGNLLLTAMSKMLVTRGVALLYDPVQDAFRAAVVKGIPGLKRDTVLKIKGLALEGHLSDKQVPGALADYGVRLVFPVVFGDRQIGLIGLGAKYTGKAFASHELEFMSSLVNISSAAVHNSLLVEELRQANMDLDGKVQQLNTLFDLSQEFNATHERERLVKLLTFALMGQMLVQKHVFLLKSEDGDDQAGELEVRVVAAKGVDKEAFSASLVKKICSLGELHLVDENKGKFSKQLKGLGISLVLPIRQKGETVAALCLGAKMTGKAYQPDDIEFLYSLGNLAFVSLQNSYLVAQQLEKQKLEEEMRLAREIQERLQPEKLPEIEGLESACLALPSRHVAGDYFDGIKLGPKKILIAIADVTGKGVPAALLMSNLQACLHVLVPMDVTLEGAVAQINKVITQNTGFDKFITYFHGIYDGDARTFEYVNAGHNPPTLVRANGDIELLDEGGLLLGVIKDAEYVRGSTPLEKGDVLALFTDGVTEAMSPEEEEYGEERLEALLKKTRKRSAQEILDVIREDIRDFTCNAPVLSDDLTMLIIKVVDPGVDTRPDKCAAAEGERIPST